MCSKYASSRRKIDRSGEIKRYTWFHVLNVVAFTKEATLRLSLLSVLLLRAIDEIDYVT